MQYLAIIKENIRGDDFVMELYSSGGLLRGYNDTLKETQDILEQDGYTFQFKGGTTGLGYFEVWVKDKIDKVSG